MTCHSIRSNKVDPCKSLLHNDLFRLPVCKIVQISLEGKTDLCPYLFPFQADRSFHSRLTILDHKRITFYFGSFVTRFFFYHLFAIPVSHHFQISAQHLRCYSARCPCGLVRHYQNLDRTFCLLLYRVWSRICLKVNIKNIREGFLVQKNAVLID